jgi:mercuric ion binding protein
MKALFLLLALSGAWDASVPKRVEATFRVEGLCGMCEERIETALDRKGVVVADWDAHSRMLRVVYKPALITEAEIHATLAAAGHDTEQAKAPDAAYAGLHGCCKYRENAGCTGGDHTH